MAKYRIAILGIGGVGGYLGGMLIAAGNKDTEIIFIARTQSKDILTQKGLKLITNGAERILHPDIVSDDPHEIGHVDLLLCSVKGYDLETSLLPYESCIDSTSIILPLLNGVDIAAQVKDMVPNVNVQVWEGCIYIFARQLEKGVVEQTGAVSLIFGSTGAPAPLLAKVGDLFKAVGINTTVSTDIEAEIWKKFLFISVMATATSYFNTALGPIRDNPANYADTKKLLEEATRVAQASGIAIPKELVDGIAKKIDTLPADATSSMYADFQKGGKTELESLTGEVIRLAKKVSVPTPNYQKMYDRLKAR